MLYEVKGWTYCWSSYVSIDLELDFFTSKTSSAQIHDITIYEEETFFWQKNTFAIYGLTTDKRTPTNVTIKTTNPITPLAGFSLYGEVRYKAIRRNKAAQLVHCDENMRFSIPDHCLSCNGNPPKCVGSIDLDTKISRINIKKHK
uniref:Uncharacterized protein n=1 Tax=Parastrongyloides trichosuri TaxID=131310 RepID=A0A0N4ZAM7_PARTI